VAERTWEMVERFGTIRRDAIQRQRRANITHRVVCQVSFESRGRQWCQHCWQAARGEPELVWGGGSLSIHGVPLSAKSRQNEIEISSQTIVIVLLIFRNLGYICCVVEARRRGLRRFTGFMPANPPVATGGKGAKGGKPPAQVASGPAAAVRRRRDLVRALHAAHRGPDGPIRPSCVSIACKGARKRRRSEEQGITRAWRISRNN
jgi:hypothetical protein